MNAVPLLFVILSAVLFGASTPLAKLLLGEIHPIALAGLLYAGVFLGLGAYTLVTRGLKDNNFLFCCAGWMSIRASILPCPIVSVECKYRQYRSGLLGTLTLQLRTQYRHFWVWWFLCLPVVLK
jgi:hypothetical protein